MIEDLYNKFLMCSGGVSTDTRAIKKDSIFFALKGANFNGNLFATEALNLGAKYVVIDEAAEQTNDDRLIVVDNVLKTLQDLAHCHRKKCKIPVFGITGSNGKTTTKELIKAVLQTTYKTYTTKGNLNNHIGVPLSLLEIKSDHQIAVIEMGANKHGDIKELCDIADPDNGLITNVGKAHLEGFINFEGVKKTKKELYDHIVAKKGKLIVNGEDNNLLDMSNGGDCFMFGSDNFPVNGSFIKSNPFVHFKWSYDAYQSGLVETTMVGDYNYTNMMSAAAVGVFYDVKPELISKAIADYVPTNNRSQVIKKMDKTIILDAYNANPTSMKAAITNFSAMDGDKICLLGDMLELGNDSLSEHQAIVQLVTSLKLEAIYVGACFKVAINDEHKHFNNTEDLQEHLKSYGVAANMILLKGSRGISLETLIDVI